MLHLLITALLISPSHAQTVNDSVDPFGGSDGFHDIGEFERPSPRATQQDHLPNSTRQRRKEFRNPYSDCLMAANKKGMNYGDALKYCKSQKEKHGGADITDVFADIKEEHDNNNKRVPVEVLYSKDGKIVQDFYTPEDFEVILESLRKRKIEVQIQQGQIVLMASALSGGRIQVGLTNAKQWSKYMGQRGSSVPPQTRRFLGKMVVSPLKFVAKRILWPFAGAKKAMAADRCSPYRTPEGLNQFFKSDNNTQYQIASFCPQFASELINLSHRIK